MMKMSNKRIKLNIEAMQPFGDKKHLYIDKSHMNF